MHPRCPVLLLSALLSAAACGDNLATSDPVRDGSRIRIPQWMYEDGSTERARAAYFDAEIGKPCRPTRFSDGGTYCLPEAFPAIYTDGTCKKALAKGTGARDVELAYRTYWVGDTELPSRVYRIGERVAVPAERWELRDDFCYGPYLPDTTAIYRSLDHEVDVVRIRYLPTFEADGFRIESATSADGLAAPERIIDTSLGVRCDLAAAANQLSTTCKPRDVPAATFFTDAACTRLGIAAPERPPVATIHDDVTFCDRYFLVGDEVSSLYSGSQGGCGQVSPFGSYFAITNELALPALARVAAGDRDLQPIVVGGMPIVDSVLHDRARGVDCSGEAVDGERYCLPAAPSAVQQLYSDAACTSPLTVAIVGTGTCATPGRYARDQNVFYEVGDRYAGLLFARSSSSMSCGVTRIAGSFEAHVVGPAIPHTSFPHATPIN
jgi:hypothetical protein